MQMARNGGGKVLILAGAIALASGGCGGGNRLITVRDGAVESGTLVFDSIPAAPSTDEYVIGQGDRLDIVFPFNSQFDQIDTPVRPDGKITVALIGDVQAAGMTVSKLDSVITRGYAEFLVNPRPAVVVKKFATPVVYVLGEVSTPGAFPHERGLTLLGALALGRGPTAKGASNGVLVIRMISPERIIGIQVDYGDIAGGKRFDLNVPIEAGDIVLVPKSRIAKGQDFAVALYDILAKPMDLYLKGWQVANTQVMFDYYKRIGQL